MKRLLLFLLLLLLLLLTVIDLSLGSSSPHTSTEKTYKEQIYINETMQKKHSIINTNTVNTSTLITKIRTIQDTPK